MNNVHSLEKRQFLQGDRVFLADGPYQGTGGIFVDFLEDVKWANIAQENGLTRRHPAVWLRHGDFTPLIVLPEVRPH